MWNTVSDASRNRMRLQIFEPDHVESVGMGGLQMDWRRHSGQQSLLPAARTQTPTVARFQPRKTELRSGCHEVVTPSERKLQKLSRQPGTHHVRPMVGSVCPAAAVSEKSGQGRVGTRQQFSAKNIQSSHETAKPCTLNNEVSPGGQPMFFMLTQPAPMGEPLGPKTGKTPPFCSRLLRGFHTPPNRHPFLFADAA